VSSVFSDRGLVQHAPYTRASTVFHGLTRAAAQDYAAENIRITTAPRRHRHPMLDTNRGHGDQMTAFIPLRRLGLPAEVARDHLFMLSDAASYMTGARVRSMAAF